MTTELKTSDFDYELPPHLIAQHPLPERTRSRLLTINCHKKSINHHIFNELINFFTEKDLLVFNDTRVIPARLLGRKSTGGKVECFIERILEDNQVWAQIRASNVPKAGSWIEIKNSFIIKVLERKEDLFRLRFESDQSVLSLLQTHGALPLPGYIDRLPTHVDQERYQTVYARREGAVAAPTAGLHFDRPLIGALKKKGVGTAYVTLHVGAGTFQPVRVESLSQHKMHTEHIEVSQEVCDLIDRCKRQGGRVIAVGTTVARCLETVFRLGDTKGYTGETDLFIYPGYSFRCVDALITNFHLPKSSLLMLVSAFGGYELIQRAYQEAIKQQYRFYSYGDAMLII